VSPDLNKYVVDSLVDDRLREAERFRRSRFERSSETPDAYESVTVRLARPTDAEAVLELSERDGHRVPHGSVLVAEVNGAVLAARSLESGTSVADPFRPTAHLTELLELRSAHLRNAADSGVHPPRRRGIRAWLRSLIGGRQRA
jgi:hypothetical protein